MTAEKAPSGCFESNRLICGLRAGTEDVEEIATRPRAKFSSPFAAYSSEVLSAGPERLANLLLFENYRFGLPAIKENVVEIEFEGVLREFTEPLVTVGRDEANLYRLKDTSISRRHCVLVNYSGDVWVHDLASKFGVMVDGTLIKGKAYLDGVHTLTIGNTDLKISSKAGLLV